MPEKKKFNFKMGSDPEFSFIMQGRRVNACKLLKMNLENKKEFKDTMSNGNAGGYKIAGGEIGWDGSDATAELRPEPSNSVDEIVSNIKLLLTETNKQFPTFDLSVLSNYAPAGGHIHFQISKEMHENKQRIQLLHKKISSFFLPIMMSENKINLRLRTADYGGSKKYGDLTDFHADKDNVYIKKDGTADYTYEFRTPSAEWLITEKICRATFAYLGTIYNEIINNPENFSKYMSVVYKNDEQAKSLHQLIITDYVGITESLFNQIKKAVKTFELYPQYKEEIDYILNPVKVMADKKKTNYDIIEGWNLVKVNKTKNPSAKNLLNNKKFKELSSKINLDTMSMLVNITYNDDINVEYFARALSERAVAFNWKLKNSYFLFGMKKGLNNHIVFNQDSEVIMGKEIIKTEEDKNALKELTRRISDKFLNSQQKQINLTTGAVEKSNVIIIGLPYQMRADRNHRDFIKIVHQLEEGKLKPVAIDACYKDLLNDLDLPDSEKGSVYKYVNSIEDKPVDEALIPYDRGSQGAEIAQSNTRLVISQIERDEIDNRELVEVPSTSLCATL